MRRVGDGDAPAKVSPVRRIRRPPRPGDDGAGDGRASDHEHDHEREHEREHERGRGTGPRRKDEGGRVDEYA